jgi:hypothetical protein
LHEDSRGVASPVSDFVERASQCADKDELEKSVTGSLKDLFGEPAASSIIYHLGGSNVLRDPKSLKAQIDAIFGIGANIILAQILKDLEAPYRPRRR